ncbi:MAG TPA: AAA family ATPase [Candidatus Omnitrophica bacterium]|nr:AAA family ATPase [Candidatus Omnitrophota bacterium]
MNSDKVLEKITSFYLNSNDFNGIPITGLGKDFEKTKEILARLLKREKVVLNFGDRHPNPHILAFEPEPKEEQIKKLNKLRFENPIYEKYGPLKVQINSINCCVYPSKTHLKSVVNQDEYKDRPYTLLLTLGEPQLSYRTFNLRVLEFYRNDPRYHYETDDIHGSISVKSGSNLKNQDEVFLQTFGFAYDRDIKNRYVAVFLRYLSDLTPEHQQRWRLEEFIGDTFLHPDYARATCGHWPEKESIFNAFCEEIRIINGMALKIFGKQLFKKTYDRCKKPKKFGFLVRPTREEYENFILLLDKMMSDNLDEDFFKDKVSLEQNKRTITLLEEWLDRSVKFPNPKPKDEMIKTFRGIRSERSKPAHHIRDDEWDSIYFAKQREMIIKAYQAVRTLRLIFANHPLAKTIEIPDWLYQGKIWTY